MRKGLRTFCNGDGSTSTLDQQNSYLANPSNDHNISGSTSNEVGTLEEMILKLELEEERARKANSNKNNTNTTIGRRMSCVNNTNSSDILMSARNAALNQYPRFSLDGKDAMYRSSFRNNYVQTEGRRSVCCGELGKMRGRFYSDALPPTLAGESVVWCKPGVVAKLMGLEAVPVPVKRPRLNPKKKKHHEVVNMDMDHHHHDQETLFRMRGSKCKTSSSTDASYCVMKPMEVESGGRAGGGWPTRRFL